jgi:hypothetical protein
MTEASRPVLAGTAGQSQIINIQEEERKLDYIMSQ